MLVWKFLERHRLNITTSFVAQSSGAVSNFSMCNKLSHKKILLTDQFNPHRAKKPSLPFTHGAFVRALAESLQSRDILVTFGKMAVGSFMHCAILTISLEHIDRRCKLVFSFGLLVHSDCVLS